MKGLFARFIIFPIVIYAAVLLLGNQIILGGISQLLLLSFILGTAAYLTDMLFFKDTSIAVMTLIDLVGAFAVVVGYQFLVPVTRITLTGALLTAFLIAVAEYIVHRYLRARVVDTH